MTYRYFEQYELFLPLPEVVKPNIRDYHHEDFAFGNSVTDYERYAKDLEAYNKWLSSGIHILKEHLHLFVGRDVDESEFEIELISDDCVNYKSVAIPVGVMKEYKIAQNNCSHACNVTDFKEGGRCHKNECYSLKQSMQREQYPDDDRAIQIKNELWQIKPLPVQLTAIPKSKEQEHEEESYPGITYQRLFEAIACTAGIATQSEMDGIINIVKEDFLKEDNLDSFLKRQKLPSGEEMDCIDRAYQKTFSDKPVKFESKEQEQESNQLKSWKWWQSIGEKKRLALGLDNEGKTIEEIYLQEQEHNVDSEKENDLVTSQLQNSDSVATLPCTSGNSIQQLSESYPFKRALMEAGKGYACKEVNSVIVNDPDKYSAFRDGQQSAIALLIKWLNEK
jgi:hypothetical protein